MKTVFKLIWIILIVQGVACCGIARFDLDRDFTCGSSDYQMFTVNDFPADFVGTDSLTLGIWFQYNLGPTNPLETWIILYKLTVTDADPDRQPAFYFWANSTIFWTAHVFNGVTYAGTSPTWQPQVGSWYFATEAVDLTSGTTTMTFVNPSQLSSQYVTYYDQLSQNQTGFSYDSNHKLYFGAESQTYTRGCLGIWYPFMITGFTPTSNGTLLSLAFGIVPFSIQTLLLQPFEVYNNLFNDQDDSDILYTQGDPGLFWSESQQKYPALPDFSASPSSLSTFKASFSFMNVNQSLSFSMRFKFMIQNYTSDTCSIYWLVRRISGGQTTFGFGISKTGNAVIQLGSTQLSQTDTKYVWGNYGVWQNLMFGCYEQWLSTKICLFYHDGNYTTPSFIIFPGGTTYTENLTEDTILLGNPDSQQCGGFSVHSLTINQGSMIIPLIECYGGCIVSTGGTSSSCYVRDTGSASPLCPSSSLSISNSKDCVPCPLGCASCTVADTTSFNVTCTSCSQGYTLINASGICGCINSYYFAIDSVTNQGECIAKDNISATISSTSQVDLVFSCVTSQLGYYSKKSQISVILPLIKISLQGVLLNSNSDYNLTFENSNQLSITLLLNASVNNNSVLSADFSNYNAIEGLSTMIIPSNVSYTISQGYAYLDPQTQKTIANLAQVSSTGAFVASSGTSIFAILLGGISGAAVFLLQALSELEMYKYLNINFPKNFVLFYDSLYSTSVIPNFYSYLRRNKTVAISTYYKFADWQTPVLFLEKNGDVLIKEETVLILILFTGFLQLLFLKNRKRSKFFQKVSHIFRWNLIFSFLLADFTSFVVQIALQFRQAPFITSDVYTIVSTAISVIVLISYALIFPVGLYQINRKRLEVPEYLSEAKQKLKARLKKEKFPAGLMLFKEGFKEDTAFDKNCLLIIKLEDIILSMNFIFMQDMPLAQCYIYTVVIGFWLLMIVIGKPIKTRTGATIFVLNELLKLILGIFAILLATNETVDFLNEDNILMMGTIMIYLVIGVLVLNTMISIGLVVYSIYQVGRKCCKGSKQPNGKPERFSLQNRSDMNLNIRYSIK